MSARAFDRAAGLRGLPEVLGDLPLHEPFDPAEHGLHPPLPAAPGMLIYPDHFTIGDDADYDMLAELAPALSVPGRAPLGLMLLAASLSRSIARGLRFVLVRSIAADPLADLLLALNPRRPITTIVIGDAPHSPDMPTPSELHSVILAPPGFTMADLRPGLVGLLYLADFTLPDAHWNWFHPERLVETGDASLAVGGVVMIAGAERHNVVMAIRENFLALHAGRYDIAYDGRFGVPRATGMLILRKHDELAAPIRAAMQAASRALFADKVSLSHEMDRRLAMLPTASLEFGTGMFRDVSYVITPRRSIRIESVVDRRFRERFPAYFAAGYTAPEIRLNRVPDGILFSRLPTCVATADGTVFLSDYCLEEFMERSQTHDWSRSDMTARRDSGACYVPAFSLTPEVLRDGIRELTNYIEQPVFYFGIRWMDMYGHFMHEACPQIGLWRRYLEPLGVRLLVHPLSKQWQWDALRSLGIRDEDMLIYPPNSAIMCRELWFTHSFEDARYAVLPEITDFATNTDLSDPTRRRTLRVYAARTDTPNRKLVNEAELIARLRQEGFVIFVGGEHSLAEQIALFEQADIIVGKDGTNLTNIIFGDRTTLLVEILGEDFFDPLYLRIANMRQMHYDHVLARTVRGAGRLAESVVDVDEVVNTIHRADARRRQQTIA